MNRLDLQFEVDVFDKHLAQLREDAPFSYWPHPELDHLLNGVRGSSLVTVMAKPGLGKTTLISELVDCIAAEGHTCIYGSLDEPACKIVKRSIARISNGLIPLSAVGIASDNDIRPHIDRYLELIAPNVAFFEAPKTIKEISALTSNAIRGRDGKALLVVDYAQIVTAEEDAGKDERGHVRDVVAGLRKIANKHDIAVVAISSINRNSYTSGALSLSSASESNSIEYLSDQVIALNVSGSPGEAKKHMEQEIRPVEISILKNRFGPLGQVEMDFDTVHAAFLEKGLSR